MNGYLAFYKGKKIEIYAATSYEAQKKAALAFRARKQYDVTVVLCEKEGVQVAYAATL